jgi:hypothetical protein
MPNPYMDIDIKMTLTEDVFWLIWKGEECKLEVYINLREYEKIPIFTN